MRKKILSFLTIMLLLPLGGLQSFAEGAEDFTTLRSIDKGTFNEYRYLMTKDFFDLRRSFEVNNTMSLTALDSLRKNARTGYNYLPQNLNNDNLLDKLLIAIDKSKKYPSSDSEYNNLQSAIGNYLDKVSITALTGSMNATPISGNAPHTTTLRANIVDPNGTKIPQANYTWWIDNAGKKEVIGNKISLAHTFREEGSYAVWLDVTSAHKNEAGFTDVLPFRGKKTIEVKEKIASLIIDVSGERLYNKEVLKFTPEEAAYGLLFDATSSTPTSGTKFVRTEWDFGNGIKKSYKGEAKIERVKYTREGTYDVSLKFKTNTGKTVSREFQLEIHDPIATIVSSGEQGFIGDKFTFSSKNSVNNDNLSYEWEILDVDRDDIILKKAGSLFTYEFTKKGRFSVKLRTREPSGETDVDTKTIYINSRAPFATFDSTVQFSHTPNTVTLDASKSYDADPDDDGSLNFSWKIDGERIFLDDANYNGSIGKYTFDSLGDHSVVLEVTDNDDIVSIKRGTVQINSLLSVDFVAAPRVIQRGQVMRFVASAPNARFFEWDFGDGTKVAGNERNMTHNYKKSGIYTVKLVVKDSDGKSNTRSKEVYVGDSNTPVALIDSNIGSGAESIFDEKACKYGAYVISRKNTLSLSGNESIDIDGNTGGLTYSWKIGNDLLYSGSNISYSFDELGCFPVKLTVKSDKNNATATRTMYFDVRNSLPDLATLDVQVQDIESDPVVVNVTAQGAKDEDGVIQSYLWYYYTDIDNQPQDFRITQSATTTFVLPKVSGTYYFVVVMEDDNGGRQNSEEATGSQFFTTLSGDNINTPLVDLRVNDNSLGVNEEVIFTATAKNIVGQNISKTSQYFWDFDGDGFYDTKSDLPEAEHFYEKSGEYHAKVKVSHKGYSNVKTVTINVENQLVPDFGYISIGNKYVFFDKSNGSPESYSWELGDGEKVTGEENFVYSYKDRKSTHLVELKISEGTKLVPIKKKVVKSNKNIILARKTGAVFFTSPSYDTKNEQVVLSKSNQKLFVYLGESSITENNENASIASYGIDFDIGYDSDLNGGKDDDADNKNHSSYTTGIPVEVELNDFREQTVRVFIQDADGNLLDVKDIKILKEYIVDETVDLDALEFQGVTEREKEKIEELKVLIQGLSTENRLKGMKYIQKLQEDYFDSTEKVKTILEFEAFLGNSGEENYLEIFEVLESLLIDEGEVKDEKTIAYKALTGLLPGNIECSYPAGEFSSCHAYLSELLEKIKDSSNIEENKLFGKEVLQAVAQNSKLSAADKTDFKSILKPLVYGGYDNVPQEEKELSQEEEENDASEDGESSGLLKKVLFGLMMLILTFAVLSGLYFLYYKLSHKGGSESFEDFVKEKTGAEEEDPLMDVLGIQEEKNTEKTKASEDPLAEFSAKPEVKKPEIKKPQEPKQEKKSEGSTPDWLAGINDATPKTEKKSSEKKHPLPKKEEKAKTVPQATEEDFSKSSVPDWLKGTGVEDTETKKSDNKKPEDKKSQAPATKEKTPPKETPKKTPEKSLDEVTKVEEEKPVPDWLSGASKEETKKTKETKAEVPDWLKGSFDAPKEEKTNVGVIEEATKKPAPQKKKEAPKKETFEPYEDVKEPQKKTSSQKKIPEPQKKTPEKIPPQKSEKKAPNSSPNKTKNETEKQEKKPAAKPERKPQKTAQNPKPVEKKAAPKKPETKKPETKKATTTKNTTPKDTKAPTEEKKKDELWDDGMKIPDWLKDDTTS